MNHSPAVSVIMNCYNGEQYLKQAIDSVYAQTFSDWEIIFWDNASIDNSPQIAKSYDDRIKYFRSNKNTSLGGARNAALNKVSGKYICFLDVDDLMSSNRLEIQTAFMDKHKFKISCSSVTVIDGSGKKIKNHKMPYKNGNNFQTLLYRYVIYMQSVMLDRSFIDEGLHFDAGLRYSPDYKLFMEICMSHSLGVIEESLVQYRVHDNNLSQQLLDIIPQELESCLTYLQSKYPDIAIRYALDFDYAMAKLNLYRARAAIFQSDIISARKYIKILSKHDQKFILLYWVMCLPRKFYNLLVSLFNINMPPLHKGL